MLVVDYAWTKPNPAAIKAAGYIGAARYLSNDPSKDLTLSELQALHAVGLDVLVVWETTAARALGGLVAGTNDGIAANALADTLDWPTDRPIFYAVDQDVSVTQMPLVLAYLKACAGKRPVGVYGSMAVVDAAFAAGAVKYGWQTEAWSGTKISPNACLYQRVSHTLPAIAGVAANAYDEDVVLKPDWGAWDGTAAAPAPSPDVQPLAPPVEAPVVGGSPTMYVRAPNGAVAIVDVWTWTKRHLVPGNEWDVVKAFVTIHQLTQAQYDAIPDAT